MALEQMDAQITSLLVAIREQNAGSKDVLEKLQQGTSTMVSGLINGAEKIGGAASRFELAGNAVSVSTDKSANLISLVNRTTEHLGGASDRLAALIDDYESTKELVQKVISGAEKVSLTLESDASSREKMTQDLASVAEKLGSVTTEMKTYLRDFNGVVTTSFGSFTDGMNGSLSKVMSSLDNELDRAVKALGSGVSELAEVVEELSEVRVK
jgi:putative membrane protein